jgi:hypothetical protein
MVKHAGEHGSGRAVAAPRKCKWRSRPKKSKRAIVKQCTRASYIGLMMKEKSGLPKKLHEGTVTARTRDSVLIASAASLRNGRRWENALTLAPSRWRHRRTHLPAGFGCFLACPDCVRHHELPPRAKGECDSAYFARADARAALCPFWDRRSAQGWENTAVAAALKPGCAGVAKGTFLGYYVGVRRDADSTGAYAMLLSTTQLPSVTSPFVVDGAGRHGSLMSRCNGVDSSLDPRCNAVIGETAAHPVLYLPKNVVAVPVVALRDVHFHAEILFSYGKGYFKGNPVLREFDFFPDV